MEIKRRGGMVVLLVRLSEDQDQDQDQGFYPPAFRDAARVYLDWQVILTITRPSDYDTDGL